MDTLTQILQLINQGHKPCTDTRAINQGDIFFALKGENFDGNKFAKQALQSGAHLAICDDSNLLNQEGIIVVQNTLDFLQDLARAHRSNLNIPVIGLTGSNGKTTTKELLNAVLSTKYKTFATPGNLNNHIGVPLSILSITPQHQMAIIEMGANHMGEIESLCSIAQPTHALITNIGKAHLEGFGSLEGVVKAKGELYAYMAKHKGVTFIDAQNELLLTLAKTYDLQQTAEYNNKALKINTLEGNSPFVKVEIEQNGITTPIETQLVGEYNEKNILAAIAIGNYFGIDMDQSARAVEDYVPTNNRSQIIHSPNNTIILDAYNANPSSMTAALQNFKHMSSPKPKVVILGEMLELGEYANKEHEQIYQLARHSFDMVITIGPHYEPYIQSPHLWFPTTNDLKEFLMQNPLTEKCILIKGSRGMQLEKLVETL